MIKQFQTKIKQSRLFGQIAQIIEQVESHKRSFSIFGIALLCLAPLGLQNYLLGLLVLGLIFAIFAISVDLLWGYGGILTFGHAAFFGLGAYTMAKVLDGLAISGASYLGLTLSIVLSGFIGLIIGGLLFYRDVTGTYFTIITLILVIIAQQLTISFASITGGYNGISGIPPLELGIPYIMLITMDQALLYYFVLVSTVAVYFLAKRIVQSRFGTTITGIEQNEQKAKALGYNTAKYKTILFGLASAIAGFAGALYTSYSGFVGPDSIGFQLSTEVLIWVLVGGRGTIIGPAIGAVLLTFFENIISGVFLYTWTLFLGLLLIIIVLVFPSGLVGIIRQFTTEDDNPETDSAD